MRQLSDALADETAMRASSVIYILVALASNRKARTHYCVD